MLPDDSTPSRRPLPGPKPVAQSAPVKALSARARELDNLDRQLRQSLPPPLNERLHYAGVRGTRATLLATSPAWASRARMAQPKILAILRALGVPAETISIKVVAAPSPPAEPVASLPLSAASARHLRAAAKTLADPELQALFLEMASFAEKNSCS
ncbi:MAG TPA: DciA family protein [Rhodanobacteraceae bacterium]|nr:DciA family protein [Rhodanobacteraceae bacterium]